MKEKEIRKRLHAIDLTEQFAKLVRYRIPTGIIAVDRIIHGGVPSGKITELYGGWSAGKTRLLLHIIAQTLRLGGWAVLIDEERALEAGLCDLVGLDVNHPKFICVDPDDIETVEEVFEFIAKTIDIIRTEDPDGFLLIGWDSLASTPTKDDLKESEDIGEKVNIAGARRAKLIGRGLRKVSSKLYKTHSCLVIVNQLIDRFDVMFGDKTTTPGGKAVKFHSSLRMKLTLIKKMRDTKTEEQIGNNVKLVIEKSRIGTPFGMIKFEMLVKEPISEYAGLLDYMIRHEEVIQQGKNIYTFVGSKVEWTKATFPEHYEAKFREKEKK